MATYVYNLSYFMNFLNEIVKSVYDNILAERKNTFKSIAHNFLIFPFFFYFLLKSNCFLNIFCLFWATFVVNCFHFDDHIET